MVDNTPVTVVSVLNWNNYEDTADCIEDLKEMTGNKVKILVIDNGSTDDSPERIEDNFPEVTLLRSEDNRGFAGGHNIAIKHAYEIGADYIWILNNDVLIRDANLLNKLIRRFENNPSLGCISPLVFRYPDTDEIWFSRGYVNPQLGGAGHINDAQPDEGLITNTEYLPFCASLFKMEVFTDIGLLPEHYFLYMEDADYCQKLARNGYNIAVDTNVSLFHKGSASSGGKVSPTPLYYMARNRWLFAREQSGRITILFLASYMKWLVFQIVRCIYHLRFSGIVALLLGSFDGWQNVTGKGPYP